MNTAQFIDELKKIDNINVSTSAQDIATACIDWRKRYRSTAIAVVDAKSTSAVQAVVAFCDQHGIAITCQGGNTGLVGGSVPTIDTDHVSKTENSVPRPEVLLRLNKLKETLSIDVANMTITASAGFTLYEVQSFAKEHGFLFPLSLASEGSCTIGGNLASNAGGVAVLKYGNARELCLGLEFVDAQGRLAGKLSGLRKDNTGYDLRHLLIGSEGTLGIITQACLKIFPSAKSRIAAWMAINDLRAAVWVLTKLQQRHQGELCSFEWMNSESAQLVSSFLGEQLPLPPGGHDHLLVEIESNQDEHQLRAALETTLANLMEVSDPMVLNAVISQNLGDIRQFWRFRESISEAQAAHGLNIKHDVACSVSSIADFHDSALSAIAQQGIKVKPILFGHLGDGNLHFNLSAPTGVDSRDFLDEHQAIINQLVHQAILEVGGTISAEHGIGQLKADLLKATANPVNYELWLGIKKAMDPKGILNPGKLLKTATNNRDEFGN